MKVIFIGAGNLATRLSQEMRRVGFTILQVYSHTQANAEQLGKVLGCMWTNRLEDIREDADLYVFSLKDTALADVIAGMKPNGGVWVHTAGSMPIDIFSGYAGRYGVLYPLQTFSKKRPVDFSVIPFFLEADTPETGKILQKVAASVSGKVSFLSSEKRKHLHLAAVFACNFTNHIYALAVKLLAEQGISSEVLLPLIDETAAKIHSMTPAEAQTGPAIRYDENVIGKHLEILSDPDMKSIYQLISQSIHKEASDE